MSGISLVQTDDDGYAILGLNDTSDFRSSSWSITLMKTDKNGDLEWEKNYRTLDVRYFPNRLFQTNDSGYLFFCGAMVKTDSQGNIQWQKNMSAAAVIKTSDDGYAIVSGNLSGNSLIKINSLGDVLWNYTFMETPQNKDNYEVFMSSLIETKDGGFAVTGSWGSDAALFARFDTAGNLLLNKTYTKTMLSNISDISIYNLEQPSFSFIFQTNDNEFTVLVSSFMNGILQSWTAKLDQNGNMHG
jgi:hypothetical protein